MDRLSGISKYNGVSCARCLNVKLLKMCMCVCVSRIFCSPERPGASPYWLCPAENPGTYPP